MSITTRFRHFSRTAILNVVGRFARPSKSIHILNGHVIGANGARSREDFRLLLGQLARDVDLVRIEKAVDLILNRQAVARPIIAFTFDDGFEDCYSYIAPVLEDFGVNGAFFVNPGFIDGDDCYRREFFKRAVPTFEPRMPMTAAMVRELAERGHVIGAHTIDHVRMNTTDPTIIERQIGGCRKRVEEITGQTCDWFAWTYGKDADISFAALNAALLAYRVVFSSDSYESYTRVERRVLNRRHAECDWPISHVKFFLAGRRAYV